MSYLGTTKIGKMFLGAVEIAKAYLGTTLVFNKGGGAPSPVFYDRLVFDGTAYIDTDIIPDANASYRVYLSDETIKAAQRVFLIPASNSAVIGIVYTGNTNSTQRVIGGYYGTSSLSVSTSLVWTTNAFSLWMTPKRMGISSNSSTFTKGSNTPSGGLVLGSKADHSGQPFSGRCGMFRIYGSDAQNVTSYSGFDSYTPVYTLRPCTYNGEAGMWCVETSTFYGNTAGAGTLSVLNIS